MRVEGGKTEGAAPLLLVVEDDRRMRKYLCTTLVDRGFRVLEAESGREALAQAAVHNPELVLLDYSLPDVDGLEVTTRLREWCGAPILILSVRDDAEGKVTALDGGANDYLTKPFRVPELLARIRVWLRQAQGSGAGGADAVVEIGDLKVDFARRLVFSAGVEVHLTATEYKLLALLVRNAGKLLTHEEILAAAWGPAYTKEPQYVRVYMRQLRQKLERDPSRPRYLTTEPGIGYRLRTT